MLDPIIHTKLEEHYQKAYQLLCQPEEPEELAIELLIALKQSLDAYGDPPLQLIRHITRQIACETWKGKEEEAARFALNRMIETLAYEIDGNTRAIGLVVRTAKELLCNLELQEIERQKRTFLALLVRRYIFEIYIADFKSIIICSLADEDKKQQIYQRLSHIAVNLHYVISLLKFYIMRKIAKMPPNSDQEENRKYEYRDNTI